MYISNTIIDLIHRICTISQILLTQYTATDTATRCNTLQHAATQDMPTITNSLVCCSLWHMVLFVSAAVCCIVFVYAAVCCSVLVCVAACCCCVLQCAHACCSVVLCVCTLATHPMHNIKEPYKRDFILQKRSTILRSLLTIATPYATAPT